MKNIVGSYMLMSGLSMLSDIREKNKEKLEELRKEWWAIAKWPRKKKKKRRKEILIEYQIFSYDPFTMDFTLE